MESLYTVTVDPRLIWPIVTGGLNYPEFLFSEKSKYLYKSGHKSEIHCTQTRIFLFCNRSLFGIINAVPTFNSNLFSIVNFQVSL